ncbi:MAG: type IV pilus secretin PilQ, partial [Psychromonas sp.]
MKKFNLTKLLPIFPMAVLFCSSVVFAEPQLNKVDINPMVEGKFELKFEFSDAISGFTDKLHYRPNELVINIEDASSVLELNPIKIDKGGVNNVSSQRTAEGLRLTVSLDTLMPYRIAQEKNVLFVRFGNVTAPATTTGDEGTALAAAVAQNTASQTVKAIAQAAKASPAKTSSAKTSAKTSPRPMSSETPKGYVNSINAIDFTRGSEGQGKLLIYLDNSSVAVDLRRRDQQLIAEFKSTHIANDLLYIMDVGDFATAVEKVESFTADGTTSFVFDMKDNYNYRYDQLDTLFVIEVSEKPKNEKQSEFQGKAFSLNFQDIPVRTVLQLIADFNGFNLVITDSVSGNITLRLDDVPWDQALDIILKVKGLGKRMDGNVLMIAPATELAAKERAQLESEKEVGSLAPVYSEFLQINYAKAADISAMLTNDKMTLLSERGSVSTDTRTNTLLIKDTAAIIDSVKKMIAILDIPVQQVVIEARIVSVSDSVAEDLGIQWGVTTSNSSGSFDGIGTTSTDSDTVDDRLNVNLEASSSATSIAFSIGSTDILDLALSALETESKAEVIASPRITTANQKTATIKQGTEIPYSESSSSGATTISFKEAVLSLEVTPQIT